MRYRVHGTSRSTGAASTLVVEAKDHDAAKLIATRHLIVASVAPEGGLTEPEPFEPPERGDLDELSAAVESQPQTVSPPRSRLSRKVLWLILIIAISAAALVTLLLARR